MSGLTHAQARSIAEAALAAAQGISPLCVAVLDSGGHLVALDRQDGASSYRIDIAVAKAEGCIGMGMGGRAIAARAAKVPAFYAAVNQLQPILPLPGGVLIRAADGNLLGAVGISGDTADNDERCAVAAIVATGLVADVGEA